MAIHLEEQNLTRPDGGRRPFAQGGRGKEELLCPPVMGPETDAPGTVAACGAADAENAFTVQKILGEGYVAAADIWQMRLQMGATKEFCPQSGAIRPLAQEGVDQQFHRMQTIAHGDGAPVGAIRQKEVVHPADSRARVPKAGGNTGAEDGGDHRPRIGGNLLFPLKQGKRSSRRPVGRQRLD